MRDGLAQRGVERTPGRPVDRLALVGVPRQRGPQERLAHLASRDRRDAHEVLDGRVEPLQAGAQHVRERPRQLVAQARLDELLGEVGVPLGARAHGLERRGRQRAAGERRRELPQLALGEGRELHVLDARVAQQLREHRAQGVAAVQVVRAVARDDEDVLRAQTGDDEAQDVAARRVRPVQVLDDEHERRLGRPGRRDRGGDALEELEALALALLVVGRGAGVEQARERGTGRDRLVDGGVLGAQGRERLGEGEVGEADLAEVDAVAPHHRRARPGRELRRAGEQARLAHPRVRADEHDARLAAARALDRRGEHVELGRAGHEGRARGGSGHGSHPRSGHRHVTSRLTALRRPGHPDGHDDAAGERYLVGGVGRRGHRAGWSWRRRRPRHQCSSAGSSCRRSARRRSARYSRSASNVGSMCVLMVVPVSQAPCLSDTHSRPEHRAVASVDRAPFFRGCLRSGVARGSSRLRWAPAPKAPARPSVSCPRAVAVLPALRCG